MEMRRILKVTKRDIHVTSMQFDAVCECIGIESSRVVLYHFQEIQIFIKHDN